MLTAIEIENFKGIGERARIEFAPITLLFGANSAGKSTVLHAIQYLREVLVNRNPDAGRTELGGNAIHLGGFMNLLHGRGQHGDSVALAMEFDDWWPDFASRADFPVCKADEERQQPPAPARLDIEITRTPRGPMVTRYTASSRAQTIFDLSAMTSGKNVFLDEFNLSHPVLTAGATRQQLAEDAGLEFEEEHDADNDTDEAYFYFWSAFTECETLPPGGNEPPLSLPQRDALPELNLGDSPLEPEFADRADWTVMSRVIEAFHACACAAVNKSRYLGPLRDQPERTFEQAENQDESRWSTGRAAWDELLRSGPDFARKTSDWLSHADRLDAGYAIEVRRFYEVAADGELAAALLSETLEDDPDLVRALFRQAPERVDIKFMDTRTRMHMAPQDVGVGLSQLVPVVVAALKHATMDVDITCIEQPELHMHPKVQVGLGDLFLATSHRWPIAADVPQTRHSLFPGAFLIETHSEHLILRLLKRIRQTNEEELGPAEPKAFPEDVAVYFVENNENGTHFNRIRIDRDGEFIDRWPAGFFREREKELF